MRRRDVIAAFVSVTVRITKKLMGVRIRQRSEREKISGLPGRVEGARKS